MQNAMMKPNNAGAAATTTCNCSGLVNLRLMWARMAKVAQDKMRQRRHALSDHQAVTAASSWSGCCLKRQYSCAHPDRKARPPGIWRPKRSGREDFVAAPDCSATSPDSPTYYDPHTREGVMPEAYITITFARRAAAEGRWRVA